SPTQGARASVPWRPYEPWCTPFWTPVPRAAHEREEYSRRWPETASEHWRAEHSKGHRGVAHDGLTFFAPDYNGEGGLPQARGHAVPSAATDEPQEREDEHARPNRAHRGQDRARSGDRWRRPHGADASGRTRIGARRRRHRRAARD